MFLSYFEHGQEISTLLSVSLTNLSLTDTLLKNLSLPVSKVEILS